MRRKSIVTLALILILVSMPQIALSAGEVKTDSGLHLLYLKQGSSFIATESGYFVNEKWMEEADLSLIELEECYKELENHPKKTWVTRIFWLGIGLAAGYAIGK